MRKTKIVASLGPSSNDKIEEMIKEGVDVFRINTSHASIDDCENLITEIRKYSKKLNKIVGIMLDTDGPCIRLHKFNEEEAILENGKDIRFYNYPVICNNTQVSTTCTNIANMVKIDEIISIADGEITLKVMEINDDNFLCQVINGGVIRSKQTVHIEDANYHLPFLSEKDREAILYGIKKNVDFLALSYVRDEQDVLEIVDMLIENGNEHTSIISKIENDKAFENLDEILKVSDGVMVARGDLGCNMPIEKLPFYQKRILEQARINQKIGIIATDLLKSMITGTNPSRAEVADIYNAILDKADALTLCNETAIGIDPVNCVKTTSKIIIEAENDFNYKENLDETFNLVNNDITSTIAYSVVDSSILLKANMIIANSLSGYTAKKISYFHPNCLIMGLSPNKDTLTNLTLNYGIIPILSNKFKDTDSIIEESVNKYKELFESNDDEIVIITGGIPIGKTTNTNFMKIEKVENKKMK